MTEEAKATAFTVAMLFSAIIALMCVVGLLT